MSAIAVFAPPTVISRLRAVDPLRHERLRAEHLSTAATTVLAVGVAISILTTSDKDWWRLHFSKLGTYPDLSGHVFNLTIIVAGVLFVLPSLFILIGLSWVYMAHGDMPVIAGLFYGIKPAVTALVMHAAYRIGSRTLKNAWLWGIEYAP